MYSWLSIFTLSCYGSSLMCFYRWIQIKVAWNSSYDANMLVLWKSSSLKTRDRLKKLQKVLSYTSIYRSVKLPNIALRAPTLCKMDSPLSRTSWRGLKVSRHSRLTVNILAFCLFLFIFFFPGCKKGWNRAH